MKLSEIRNRDLSYNQAAMELAKEADAISDHLFKTYKDRLSIDMIAYVMSHTIMMQSGMYMLLHDEEIKPD